MGTYGYIRVSTKEQNEDRQIIAMREFGAKNDHIILDKQSGKDFDRPGYRWLVHKPKAGDTLIIKSIDRMGRNYDEILEQWRGEGARRGPRRLPELVSGVIWTITLSSS